MTVAPRSVKRAAKRLRIAKAAERRDRMCLAGNSSPALARSLLTRLDRAMPRLEHIGTCGASRANLFRQTLSLFGPAT